MASKGIEKLVSEACKKGYSVFRKGDRIEICKPNRKMVRLNSLSVKAISRWEQALPLPPDFTGTPFDFLTDAEREARHLLLIGQMLCIDEQAEARERIKQRLASRRKGSSQQNAD